MKMAFLPIVRMNDAPAPGASPKAADEATPGSAGVPPASSESAQDARAPGKLWEDSIRRVVSSG